MTGITTSTTLRNLYTKNIAGGKQKKRSLRKKENRRPKISKV